MTTYKKLMLYVKIRRFCLYLLRWQCSTPIYSLTIATLSGYFGPTVNVIIANLIGGCIFYWIDRYIFTKHGNLQQKD